MPDTQTIVLENVFSKNNTTMTQIGSTGGGPAVEFTLGEGENYIVESFCNLTANVTGGIAFDWDVDAVLDGQIQQGRYFFFADGTVQSVVASDNIGALDAFLSNVGITNGYFHSWFYVRCVTGGKIIPRMAQVVANGSSLIQAGSYFRVSRVLG